MQALVTVGSNDGWKISLPSRSGDRGLSRDGVSCRADRVGALSRDLFGRNELNGDARGLTSEVSEEDASAAGCLFFRPMNVLIRFKPLRRLLDFSSVGVFEISRFRESSGNAPGGW